MPIIFMVELSNPSVCPTCRTTQNPRTGSHLVLTRRCRAWWRKGRKGPG